jgi:hypothetical protein
MGQIIFETDAHQFITVNKLANANANAIANGFSSDNNI